MFVRDVFFLLDLISTPKSRSSVEIWQNIAPVSKPWHLEKKKLYHRHQEQRVSSGLPASKMTAMGGKKNNINANKTHVNSVERADVRVLRLFFFSRQCVRLPQGWMALFFSFLQIVWASFTLFISYMITKALILQRCGDKACGGGKPTTHLYTHWYDAFVLAAARKMCVYLAFFIIFVKCAFTYTCNWMQLAEESVKQ